MPFPPLFINLIQEKWTMFIGALGYCVYMACLIKIIKPVLLIGAGVSGFGAMLLWVAQGAFITQCATPETIGVYSGIFWTIFQCSNVIGNFIAFFIFKYASQTTLFWSFLAGAVAGSSLLLLLKQPPQKSERCSNTELVYAMIKVGKTKELLLLIPLMFWVGFELGFWSGVFPLLLKEDSIGLVLAFAGIAEVLGGLTLGYVSDRFGCTVVLLIGFICYAFGLLLACLMIQRITWVSYPTWFINDAPWSVFVSAFCFGLGDCVFNTQIYALLGHFWKDRTLSVSAFTFFNIFSALGSAVGFYMPVLFPFSDSNTQFYVQASWLTVSIALAIFADTIGEKLSDSSIKQEGKTSIN